jgi:hypothetical protein
MNEPTEPERAPTERPGRLRRWLVPLVARVVPTLLVLLVRTHIDC